MENQPRLHLVKLAVMAEGPLEHLGANVRHPIVGLMDDLAGGNYDWWQGVTSLWCGGVYPPRLAVVLATTSNACLKAQWRLSKDARPLLEQVALGEGFDGFGLLSPPDGRTWGTITAVCTADLDYTAMDVIALLARRYPSIPVDFCFTGTLLAICDPHGFHPVNLEYPAFAQQPEGETDHVTGHDRDS